MFFNKWNLIVLALLFSLGISTTSLATECYELQRKACSGRDSSYFESEGISCQENKQQLSEILFKKYDENRSNLEKNYELYMSSNLHMIKNSKSAGIDYSFLEYQVCTYQESKKYYKSGIKPKFDTSSNQASSSSSTSNQSSSQSSNQSSSAKTSNSQVSQNKQSYQAAQLAHNQANAGKGKKHNSDAEASECMKNNANGTHWKNVCKFAVNLSYCFIGVAPGQEAEDTQILADINCQAEQYANTELSAGEELAGNYGGLTIGAFICKSPSQPVDMTFDRSEPAVTGRCSI